MHSKSQYIAVFDSGVGGISVLRELVQLMPEERYLYFGDSAHAPYGGKSPEQVRQLVMAAAEKLLSRGTKALVVACNTATAVAIDRLRQQFPHTVIIGIEPALKVAWERFPRGRVGIMATRVTLGEEKLAHQMERYPQLHMERIAAPGLVELIESGQGDSGACRALLREILTPYQGKLDALVLGCTHYPFAKAAIRDVLGPEVALLDGSQGTARQTKHCLAQAGLLSDGPGSVEIENSLGSPEILALCRKLLGR